MWIWIVSVLTCGKIMIGECLILGDFNCLMTQLWYKDWRVTLWKLLLLQYFTNVFAWVWFLFVFTFGDYMYIIQVLIWKTTFRWLVKNSRITFVAILQCQTSVMTRAGMYIVVEPSLADMSTSGSWKIIHWHYVKFMFTASLMVSKYFKGISLVIE